METIESLEYKKIEENNKKICVFSGDLYSEEYCIMTEEEDAYRICFGHDESWLPAQKLAAEKYYKENQTTMEGYKIGLIKNYPQYDRSWEYLMRAVAKIECGNYGVKICRRVVEIYIDSDKTTIIHEKRINKFESLYFAVLEFINYQQKQVNNS